MKKTIEINNINFVAPNGYVSTKMAFTSTSIKPKLQRVKKNGIFYAIGTMNHELAILTLCDDYKSDCNKLYKDNNYFKMPEQAQKVIDDIMNMAGQK